MLLLLNKNKFSTPFAPLKFNLKDMHILYIKNIDELMEWIKGLLEEEYIEIIPKNKHIQNNYLDIDDLKKEFYNNSDDYIKDYLN